MKKKKNTDDIRG